MKISTLISVTFIVVLWSGYASKVNADEVNSEDVDLGFLPPITEDKKESEDNKTLATTSEKDKNFKFTFDNTFQYNDKKDQTDLLFPSRNLSDSNWSNLTRLGLRGDVPLSPNITFNTDLLLNTYTRESDSFKASDDLRLDIKEAYLSWQQSPTQFIDVGRINIKSGVATGFNPADYFKVGTVLDRNTEDISQLRDARIGALVLRGQKLWDGGSLTMLASPKISDKEDHWSSDKDIVGLNLHKSNDRSRTMIKLNHKIADDISPEFIFYNESGNHNFGLNINRSFNDQWMGYAEWNIGERRSLIDEALDKHRNTRQLSPIVETQFPSDKGEKYQQQFAIGASFTSSSNITTNLEYHYNQAGLSKSDANKWFNTAETTVATNNYPAIGQLLSIRGLAQTRGEPLGKHSLFLRSKWADAGMNNLDLTGLLITDLNDNSHLIQAEVAYELNSKSSLAFRLAKFQGDKKSIYGSIGKDVTATLQFEYSF